MNYTSGEIWTIIVLTGIGTYLIRFSFLGLIGNKQLPEWALRHLRYTPVAVLPGLVAPLVMWPASNGGEPSAVWLAASLAAFATGIWRKNLYLAIIAGALVFAAGQLLL